MKALFNGESTFLQKITAFLRFTVKSIENEIIMKLVYYNLSVGIIKRHFGEDE